MQRPVISVKCRRTLWGASIVVAQACCNWFGIGNNRITMKEFHCVDKLPHITADDRIQPFGLLRVHGKPLHGHAFVTVAVLLILGLMAVVFFVLSTCNCCYPFVSMSFVWITFACLRCALFFNSTCLVMCTKTFAWARTAMRFHGIFKKPKRHIFHVGWCSRAKRSTA